MNLKFQLAPLRGYTNKEYRYAITKNFKGISECVMPFFSVTDNLPAKFSKYVCCFTDDELKHECNYTVIPQLIGNNPKALAGFCIMLRDNGFHNINMNLGCPMPQITKKKRGSGLLPHPDTIDSILDEIFKVDGIEFSVKVRLGMKNKSDLASVIPVLNKYPLNSVIVHPRLASDKYEGVVDLEAMKEYFPEFKMKVIYNGDIVDNQSFGKVRQLFPSVDTFMIGRGLLYKPFLTEELINGQDYSYTERLNLFNNFYADLLAAMNGKQNLSSHIKAYWFYFKALYEDGEERYRKIVRG